MAKLPSPREIGLPEKFGSWRPAQEQLFTDIQQFQASDKRAFFGCSPTGSGKSPVGVGAAIVSGEPTCYVTAFRGLQDQLMDDFESVGMVKIWGRSNYKCAMRDDYTCEEGYAAACPYKGSVGCPCSAAEMKAATSRLVVTNYDKWIASRRYGMGMDHFTQVIFDEAHEGPNAIARAMQITLNQREIEQDLCLDFLTGSAAESFTEWKKWAIEARKACDLMCREAYAKVGGIASPKPSHVKKYTHLRNLLRRLGTLSTGRVDNWIVEEREKGFEFNPIRLGPYAESTLLLRTPKIIMLTATGRPKTAYMMGLGKEDFIFREYNSDFDPRRAPIYYIPTMRVDHRNSANLPLLWLLLDQIASKRRDRKGVIHTVSYTRQNDILQASRFWESMIINEKGEAPAGILEEFYAAGDGVNLVSPSVGAGYDFRDDRARWQFMCKIPFEPPSKIVKAREVDDKEYRGYKAMQYMVQAFGRLNRSKEDWGENFIADQHLDWFLPRFGHLAPRWFHNFFQKVYSVPAPPRKELM